MLYLCFHFVISLQSQTLYFLTFFILMELNIFFNVGPLSSELFYLLQQLLLHVFHIFDSKVVDIPFWPIIVPNPLEVQHPIILSELRLLDNAGFLYLRPWPRCSSKSELFIVDKEIFCKLSSCKLICV